MKCKGFIFDLDGTLLDSMYVWENIGVEYLSAIGVKNIPQNIKERLEPLSLVEAAEYFINTLEMQKSVIQICDEVNELIEGKYRDKIGLKKGVLEFLQEHKNVDMCIATATDEHLAKMALKRLEIDKYFKFIITSTQVGVGKTDPKIYIESAKRLGTKIDETIVFEDAPHAIKSAKMAGFCVVGVWDKAFAKQKEEIIKMADFYVENLMELGVGNNEKNSYNSGFRL